MNNRTGSIGFVLATIFAVSVWAGTTGQLGGFVYDEAGFPLQGVLVSASSPAQIGAVQIATTGADGSFRFPRLAPGYYTVLIEFVGFIPQQLEQVQIRLDRVAGVQVILESTEFEGAVEVSEVTPVVDLVQVSAAQTFTSKYMTETRTDWSNLITQTAGASEDFRRVAGATPQDNGYLLDGMDSTNWYQRYPNIAARELPFDTIQEVAVHTAGYEAEFGQATGPVVNVTTKSGGNHFAGTFDARYTGSSLETAGEHYDPNVQESEDARFTATLGGPILRDNLWFFASYSRIAEKTTLTGAPATRDHQTESFLAKLTWLVSPSWSVVGKYIAAPDFDRNFNSSQFTATEATATLRGEPSIATLEAIGVLSPSILWSVRAGNQPWKETMLPADGDLLTIGHSNMETGESYGNFHRQWYASSDQDDISTDLSWLVNAAGTHELRAGLGAGNPWFTELGCLNGSGDKCRTGIEEFRFEDAVGADGDPIPYRMGASRAEGPQEFGGKFYLAYVQDAWRLRPNLTLKLGLRWDRVRWENRTQEIADLAKVQPRLGLAWDIGGNGKTALRASWGRFMHPGTAVLSTTANTSIYPNEIWLSCSYFASADPAVCAAIAEAYGIGYRTDPENWDGAGWILPPGNILGAEPSQVVDNLRPGYADQWLVAFEREVFRRTSVELTYLQKNSKDMFDDTCNGNIPELTPDSDCTYYVTANLPAVTWDYEALMLRFESRALANLHLLASWTISESRGSIDSNSGASGAFDIYPYHFVNRYGYLSDHSRHRVKLNGYWLLPYDFSIAFNGWWASEFRWTIYDNNVPGMLYGSLFVEPRGNQKAGGLHQLDFQFSKGFRLGPTRLVLLAKIVNMTNAQSENRICGSVSGCGGEFDLGAGIEWQQPRRYQLGFRVEF